MNPVDRNRVFAIIDRFVENSGGVDKVRQAVKALRVLSECKNEQIISEYVVNVGKQPAGAKQLLAAALLGFSIASALYKKKEGVKNGLQ